MKKPILLLNALVLLAALAWLSGLGPGPAFQPLADEGTVPETEALADEDTMPAAGLSAGRSPLRWDFPRLIEAREPGEEFSDLMAVKAWEDLFAFLIIREGSRARIDYYRSPASGPVQGPFTAVKSIRVEPGFHPHFDLLVREDGLYLAWNTLDGSIHLARSTDGTVWQEREPFRHEGVLSFDPRLFSAGNSILLFYHTESEGRSIDYFQAGLAHFEGAWEQSERSVSRSSGSFFPELLGNGTELWAAWQSRRLESQAPVFDIYLAKAENSGMPGTEWSEPVNLTRSDQGDDMLPRLLFSGAGLALVWQSNREGTWGIYYQEFDFDGTPAAEPVKVNTVPADARNPSPLLFDGRLHIFYLDERDGTPAIFYAVQTGQGFSEHGPLAAEEPVLELRPLERQKELYVLWRNRNGFGYSGPDRTVRQPEVLFTGGNYIGIRGVTVAWRDPPDTSGIEGYGYLFNRNESDRPMLFNLGSGTNSVKLLPDEEGEYFFHLTARDGAGNESEPLTVQFTVDLTPPPAPAFDEVWSDRAGYNSNHPDLEWETAADDVAGYTFRLARESSGSIPDTPVIKTRNPSVSFSGLEGGTWYFSAAAVDLAGNLGPASTVELRLRALPEAGGAREIPFSPPWTLLAHSFEVKPFLTIAMYLVLAGLFIVTFFTTLQVVALYRAKKQGVHMEQAADSGAVLSGTGGSKTGPAQAGRSETIRKKRFGLRFKFSVLTGFLVLLLTIGISLVLSWSAIENEKEALAVQMMEKAQLSLDSTANVAVEGLLNDDYLLLASVIQKTMQNQDIRFSAIVDKPGVVQAHSDTAMKGRELEDDFSIIAVREDQPQVYPSFNPEDLQPLYYLSEPLFFSYEDEETGKTMYRRVGTVIIGYSADSIFAAIDHAKQESLRNALWITVVTILIGIAGAILMASITIKPIKVLAKGANIIGGGNLDYRIHLKTRDEIGLLADEFNRMTARLKVYQQQVTEKAKLDEQLDIARRIQQDLIPQTGVENDQVAIKGYYQAATGVGGDYFDFIPVGNGSYGFIMSDVAGKGVPAALMMIMIRTVFRSLVHSGVRDPSRVAALINRTLSSDISSDRFATLLFGVLDTSAGRFRYTNAGYGPLLVYRSSEKTCVPVNPTVDSIPIGVIDDMSYQEEPALKLAGGDLILLCTDGIHEARNTKDEEYGLDRLISSVPAYAEQEAGQITTSIVGDVMRFAEGAEQHDDMTLLVVKMR
jgi:sigma-B regulation protein RsbU (phosphoserine phosphatase)